MEWNLNPWEGQVENDDRKLLYETVQLVKPDICVESGTWRGMGSTFYISYPLREIGKGILHTFEIDLELYKRAVTNLVNCGLMPQYVNCHFGDFVTEFNKLNPPKVDFAFIDGPDTPEYTIKSLEAVAVKMAIGNYVVFHDWKEPKCNLLKEYLKTSKEWKIDVITDTGVGACRIIKIA